MSSGQANAAIAEDKAHTLNATHETQTIATPIVIDRAAFNQGQNAQYEPHIGESEVMDSLVARGPHAVGVPFRKPKRACSTTDNETWVPADASNTLNNFDLGDTRTTHAVVEPHIVQASELRLRGQITEQKTCPTLLANTKSGDNDPLALHMMPGSVAPTVTSSGPPYSRTGNERVEAEALAVTFQPGNLRRDAGADPSFTTTTTLKASAGDQTPHVCYPIGLDEEQNAMHDKFGCLKARMEGGGFEGSVMLPNMAVRRLTPTECLRLQGFPDGWSQIPWKGKPASECPDGPQYKACGNSMAVPVMRWIGERIAAVDLTLSHA
jgi:site-specific DNA-cytosine methylase